MAFDAQSHTSDLSSRGGEPLIEAVIDIATTPVRLIGNPACGTDTARPDVRMRWDPRSSSAVPAE